MYPVRRDRDRVGALSYRDIGNLVVGHGLRTLRSYRGSAARTVGSVSAGATSAALAGYAAQKYLSRKAVVNTAGARFNPGGAGGYVATKTKSRKSTVRKVRLSRGMKKAINSLVTKKSIHWNKIHKSIYNECFRICTTSNYPCVPSTSVVENDYVGYYVHGLRTHQSIKSLIDEAYRADAYIISGTIETRQVPSATDPNATQKQYRLNFKYDFKMKNNGSQTALIQVSRLIKTDEGANAPLGELLARWNNAYCASTGVVLGSDPQSLIKSFHQGFSTPGQSKSGYNTWRQKGAIKEIVLNPGDECSLTYTHSLPYGAYNSIYALQYPKKSLGLLFRIMGSLSHSESDEKRVHHSMATCDMECNETVSVYVRDNLYTGQNRIVPNAAVSAFVDDVVAGDSTQHVVDE